jgi:site-specific recombinase XerD
MTDDQLPAIIEPAALPVPAPDDTYIVPALITDAGGDQAAWRYVEFFTANIRNPHTRRAYSRACARFFAWCEQRGLTLAAIRPHDVATYIEQLQAAGASAPSVKQQLAAVRMLFDWLVVGQVAPANPASAVRGPKHVVKTGKTPVLEGDEWRKLLDSIAATTLRDLRDRALIATLTYSFARVSAALNMKVEDLRPRGAGWTVRLHEKGGKEHAMPCHHALAEALRAYIDAASIAEDRKGFLFRTARGHNGTVLSGQPMSQPDAWRWLTRYQNEIDCIEAATERGRTAMASQRQPTGRLSHELGSTRSAKRSQPPGRCNRRTTTSHAICAARARSL